MNFYIDRKVLTINQTLTMFLYFSASVIKLKSHEPKKTKYLRIYFRAKYTR